MNWKGIITLLAVITGIYFLWTFLTKAENNPANQEAFDPPQSQIDSITTPETIDPYALAAVSGDIPSSNPQESLTYETVYNIVVEAPEIPELNTQQVIDDIVDDMNNIVNDPLPDATGGQDKTINAEPTPSAPEIIRARQIELREERSPAPTSAPLPAIIPTIKNFQITPVAPPTAFEIIRARQIELRRTR